MSKSAIYAVNTTAGTSLAAGSVYAPNQIARRFGQNVNLLGNGIAINGSGYYLIDAVVNVTATAIGNITAAIYLDGVPVVGATATVNAAAIGDVVAIPLTAIVRLFNCSESIITVVISGQTVTTNDLAITVRKE